MSKPASWTCVGGAIVLVLVGLWLFRANLLILCFVALLLANVIVIAGTRSVVETKAGALTLRRLAGTTELAWSQVAGAYVKRVSVAVHELIVFDVEGRIYRTGLRQWSTWHVDHGRVDALAGEINSHAKALPGIGDLDRTELRVALDDFRRAALLAAAGLDERGAERRIDRMMVLWFLMLFGSAALGGALAALAGSILVAYVVIVLSLAGFFVWASRQPRLPPQRQAVRLGRPRNKAIRPTDRS